MGRSPCCDKSGVKKGPWTAEEDQKLVDYIRLHGPGNWRALPSSAGLQRCGKSCRLRWTNYLRPDIKRGRFSFEEEETIIQLHGILGNKWSAIAARLPGRTDNEIKNYWNTHIRKRLLRSGIDPVTHAPRLDLLDLSSLLNAAFCNPSLLNLPNLLNPEILRLASLLLAPHKQQNPDPTLLHNLHQNLVQLLPPNLLNDHHQLQTPVSRDIPTTSTTEAAQAKSNFNNESPADDRAATASVGGLQNIIPREDLESNPCYSSLPPLSESFDLDSLMSSSPTPLDSSSTLLNSSCADDERESNCTSFFEFGIPESFAIDDFIRM